MAGGVAALAGIWKVGPAPRGLRPEGCLLSAKGAFSYQPGPEPRSTRATPQETFRLTDER